MTVKFPRDFFVVLILNPTNVANVFSEMDKSDP